MSRIRTAILGLLALPLLAACAGNNESSVLRPPSNGSMGVIPKRLPRKLPAGAKKVIEPIR